MSQRARRDVDWTGDMRRDDYNSFLFGVLLFAAMLAATALALIGEFIK